MHSLRVALSIPIVLAIAASCGGDGVDATADNAAVEIAKVVCGNMYQCCSEGEIEDILRVDEPRTQDECVADLSKIFARQKATLDFAVEESRVRFDAEAMNTCLEAHIAPDGECAVVSDIKPWAEECMQSAWVGIVPPGGKCLSRIDCDSDGFCARNQSCTAFAKENEQCDEVKLCGSNLFCDTITTTGVCRPRLAADAPCSFDEQCETNLFCNTNLFPSVCTELRDPGESCTDDSVCKSNDCIPGTCTLGGTCLGESGCRNKCEISGFSCETDVDCGAGTCPDPADPAPDIPCTTNADCTEVPGTPACVFPRRCLPNDCVGDIACAEHIVVVNYCQGALSDLPLPVSVPNPDPF